MSQGPKSCYIAPSILAADPLKFLEEVRSIEGSADFIHVDVMDGHFVPNLTFGLPIVSRLKKMTDLPLDVHIMVSNPDAVALDYVKAGADYLSFHVEAAIHPVRIAQQINEHGGKAGITINPGTPIAAIEPLFPFIRLVNVMSVNPGFGGQKFIKETVTRVRQIKNLIDKSALDHEILIEVDGGINETTGPLVREAGASVLVAGTFVFGHADRSSQIKLIK